MIFDKLIGNINCLSNEKNMGSRSGLAVWSRNSFFPYKINAILASMGSNKRRHILYKKVSSQVCRSLFPTMTSALYYKLTTSFSKYCLLHLLHVLLNTNIFLYIFFYFIYKNKKILSFILFLLAYKSIFAHNFTSLMS